MDDDDELSKTGFLPCRRMSKKKTPVAETVWARAASKDDPQRWNNAQRYKQGSKLVDANEGPMQIPELEGFSHDRRSIQEWYIAVFNITDSNGQTVQPDLKSQKLQIRYRQSRYQFEYLLK